MMSVYLDKVLDKNIVVEDKKCSMYNDIDGVQEELK